MKITKKSNKNKTKLLRKRNRKRSQKQQKQRRQFVQVKNGSMYELNGWKCITIKGAPFARGYAHGQLMKAEIEEVRTMLKFSLYEDFGRPIEVFTEMSNDFFKPQIKTNFPELYEELEGIAKGSNQSIDFIVMWNCFVSLDYLYASLSQVLEARNDKALNEKY